MENQLSLFQIEEGNHPLVNIRGEQQTTKKISYDVGEHIGGSRKDIAALRKAFEYKQSVSLLEEIEDHSPVLAAQMITKAELFKDFSLEQEKEKGTEPAVARAKQLLIQRVESAPSGDSKESRLQFMRASQYFLDRMNSIHEIDDLYPVLNDFATLIRSENRNASYYERRIGEILEERSTLDRNSEEYTKLDNDCQNMKKVIHDINRAKELGLCSLGVKFCNFFKVQSSYRSTLSNAFKVTSWDELLAKKEKRTGTKRQPVWERTLPDRPDRSGGAQSNIEKPEDLLHFFQFRGVEFGNYVDDAKGQEHLLRSSEAMMDLAELLEIDYTSISLNRTLGMAYGARGRGGSAFATFEPVANVINMTKERGCLGVFAHEWFHSLDSFLFKISHDFKNGKIGYMTELKHYGHHIDSLIFILFGELMDLIKKGNSLDYYENTNKPGESWRITSRLKIAYHRLNGDLLAIMEEHITSRKANLKSSIEFFSNFSYTDQQRIEKLQKKNERDIKKFAQALAWYHEQETGERIDQIPYPSDKSAYLQASIILDKSKEGNYWSSDCELGARAFESYIQDKLKVSGRRSDYLVSGTRDGKAFPIGAEREAINQKFETLIKYLRELKII